MKVLHLMLSCFYIEDFGYQENIIPRLNKLDGHEVKIIASTETFIDGILGYVEPTKYLNKDGIEVQRVPYSSWLPSKLARKVRSYPDIYQMIESYSPDVILFHGVPAYELKTVAEYKENHKNVKLYVDSHEDFHNSATNFVSKNILHRIFYRRIVQKSLVYIDKVLCVTPECFDFLHKMYDIPNEKMELFPLGGILINSAEKAQRREKIRKRMNLSNDDILLVHSGKMDALKKTVNILQALSRIPNPNIRLVLIGSIPEETKQTLEQMINNDERVHFLGWKSSEELTDYLCACDLYLQPGTQSATMQHALCCGSTAALYPYRSHLDLLGDSVFFIESTEDIRILLERISEDRTFLEEKRIESRHLAAEKLDYKKLARRIL